MAAKVCVAPAATDAAEGETHTDVHGVTVTVTDCEAVVSAFDIAVTVTVAGFGITLGAIYRPVVEIVP